jgi:hypothetical protein
MTRAEIEAEYNVVNGLRASQSAPKPLATPPHAHALPPRSLLGEFSGLGGTGRWP